MSLPAYTADVEAEPEAMPSEAELKGAAGGGEGGRRRSEASWTGCPRREHSTGKNPSL